QTVKQLQQGLRQAIDAHGQADQGRVFAAGIMLRFERKHRQDQEQAQHAQGEDGGQRKAGAPFGGRHGGVRRRARTVHGRGGGRGKRRRSRGGWGRGARHGRTARARRRQFQPRNGNSPPLSMISRATMDSA